MICNLHWFQLFYNRHTWGYQTMECTSRDVGTLCFLPVGIIKVYGSPSRHLPASIVFLTIIFIVGTDRSIRSNLPALIAGQMVSLAIGIFHDDIYPALRQAENGYFIRLVLPHGEITTVSQYHSYCHGGISKLMGDIISIVIDGLAVVGRNR